MSAALLLAATLTLPARAAETAPLIAAASLADVLPKVEAAWEKAGHAKVEFTFDATSRLALQIRADAPIDALFSADEEWMDALQKEGKVDARTRRDVLTNALVAVVPSAGAARVAAPADLAGPAIRHLALAGEAVPAGKYARAALEKLGLWKEVEARVVRSENVRAALRWVAAGEAEAGIVYATDPAVEPRVRTAFVFPESSHPRVVYPAAAVAGASRAREAAAFLDFCRGPEAAALFRAAGFGVPAAARP